MNPDRYLRTFDIRTIARRHLLDQVKTIGDNVYLAMHVGKRIIYVDRCLGTQRVLLDIWLGEPLSLHSTATGKLAAAIHASVLGKRATKAHERMSASCWVPPASAR